MEIKQTCPLGSDCEIIKDNQIHRCYWFVCLKGKHPQSGEPIDEWGCAIGWLPVLLVENAQTNRGQTKALEAFRNESVKRQEVFNGLISTAVKAIVQKSPHIEVLD